MRYGQAKYSSFKYGITDNPNVGWRFLVKWDDQFWTPEANRVLDLVITRGRDNMMSGDKLEPMKPGEAVFMLDNHDGRYDPFNTSSPLYNLIGPNKRLQISVKNGDTGGDWIIFTGTISEITPFGRWDKTQIRAIDDLNVLASKIVNYELVEGCRVDEAIRNVLLTAGFADTNLILDKSSDFIHYWWAAKQSAKDTIDELAQAHMDEWAVLANGKIKYKAHNRAETLKTILTSDELLKDISFLMPWDVQINEVEYRVYPIESSLEPRHIWELTSPIFIGDQDKLIIEAIFATDEGNCLAKQNGSSEIFLVGNTSKDETGTPIPLIINVSYFSSYALISIENQSGQDGYILAYEEGGNTGYINSYAYIFRNTILVGTKVAWAQSDMKLTIDSDYIQDKFLAQNYTNYLANWFSGVKHFPTIILEGRNDLQFSLDLLDKVRLKLDVLGLDAEFRIGKIETSWLNNNGSASRTVLKLEPIKTFGDYWELDVDYLGVGSILGV